MNIYSVKLSKGNIGTAKLIGDELVLKLNDNSPFIALWNIIYNSDLKLDW